MATIESIYLGDLRTEAVHQLSGNKLITDAPLDNKGKGEAFSPTDLLASSLGSCMLTIMGIAAREHGLNIDGATCSITKIMGSDPRRVTEVQIEFNMTQNDLSEKHRSILERSAITCPVAKSLHPDIKQIISFNYKS